MPRDFPDFESLKQNAKMRGWRQPYPNETEAVYRHRQAAWLRDVDRVEAAEVLSGLGWDKMSPMALLTGAGIDLTPMQSFLNLPVPEDKFQFVGEGNGRPLTDWLLDPCIAENSHYFISNAPDTPTFKIYFRKPILEKSGIVVASLSISDRVTNQDWDDKKPSRGYLRQLIEYLNAMAYYAMVPNISFELVHTQWLSSKLKDYGFKEYQELCWRLPTRDPRLLFLKDNTPERIITTALDNKIELEAFAENVFDGGILAKLKSGYGTLYYGVIHWKDLSAKAEEWLNNNVKVL